MPFTKSPLLPKHLATMDDAALRQLRTEYHRVLGILQRHSSKGAQEARKALLEAGRAIDQELERRRCDHTDTPAHAREAELSMH